MRSSWITQMDPQSNKYPCKKTEEEKTDPGKPCEDRDREQSDVITSRGDLEPPEAGGDRKGFSPRAFRTSTALPPDLWPPEL